MTGDMRTYARITINKPTDETLRLVEIALTKTNPLRYELDQEQNMFKGKTKFSWSKGTYGTEFVILIKRLGDQSIIEIYSNGWTGNLKPDTKPLIDPFYNKLSELIANRPEMDVSVVNMSQEEIVATANKTRTSNNTESVNSLAVEIAKLAKLKAGGTITGEEFTKMKNDLIDKM